MFRTLNYHGTMFRKLIEWTTKRNGVARSICLSLGRRSIEFTDDINSICYTEKGIKRLNRDDFVDYLKTTLHCPVTEAIEIWSVNPDLSDRCLYKIESNVKLLTDKGVTKIFDNPSLLSLRRETLRSRLAIMESMRHDKIEDFLPLALVSDDQLEKIQALAEEEVNQRSRHRIYHFSKLLDVSMGIILNTGCGLCFPSTYCR